MTETTYPPSEPRRISSEQKASALRSLNRSGGHLRFVQEWAKSFMIAVALFLFIRAFFVEAFKIPSGSMERTLLVGDFLLVNKLVFGAEVPFTGRHLPAVRHPDRGDVIVFEWPSDPSKNFVKRLVGLPGDTVAMRDGVLYLNGAAQREAYVTRTEPDYDPSGDEFRWQRDYLVRTAQASVGYHPSRNNWGPLVVPKQSYFVLGDNRDNSLDSRYWGFVPDSLVKGQPFLVYYSYTPDATHSLAWLTRVRWDRLGERVE
ncbi:MAG TPA: signal peptidase I [Gemmatimonadaceae bacterium]|nr:signal peptidase I [Gemmatimonadaceae bacterium]